MGNTKCSCGQDCTVMIHENLDTGEYTVSAPLFDDFSTFNEVEARDEAEDMANQLEDAGHVVHIVRL